MFTSSDAQAVPFIERVFRHPARPAIGRSTTGTFHGGCMQTESSRKSTTSRSALRRMFDALVSTVNVRGGVIDRDFPAASPPRVEALEGRMMLSVSLADTNPYNTTVYEGAASSMYICGTGTPQYSCGICTNNYTTHYIVNYGDGQTQRFNGVNVSSALSHTYSDAGAYNVVATEYDNHDNPMNAATLGEAIAPVYTVEFSTGNIQTHTRVSGNLIDLKGATSVNITVRVLHKGTPQSGVNITFKMQSGLGTNHATLDTASGTSNANGYVETSFSGISGSGTFSLEVSDDNKKVLGQVTIKL